MNNLEHSLSESLKTIKPDTPKSTSGNIIIEGIKCRYKRDVKSKVHTQSVRIYIEDDIGFSGIGNANDAIIEAIITIRNRKVQKLSTNKKEP